MEGSRVSRLSTTPLAHFPTSPPPYIPTSFLLPHNEPRDGQRLEGDGSEKQRIEDLLFVAIDGREDECGDRHDLPDSGDQFGDGEVVDRQSVVAAKFLEDLLLQ